MPVTIVNRHGGAIMKAEAVVAELRAMRLNKAADLVEGKIRETLGYYSFPDSHWRKSGRTIRWSG